MVNKIKGISSQKRGQAITEFALVLPLLLVVVIGLIEVGRAIFIYSSVTNASRDAVRYAIAFGVNADDVLHYQDCDGIRNTARKTGLLLNLEDDDFEIEYDTGLLTRTAGPDAVLGTADDILTTTTPTDADIFDTCTGSVDTAVELSCGDRIVVTVTVDYALMVPIIPLGPWPIESSAARTYFGTVEVGENADACE